jgi:hypothetical protein
MRQAMKEFEFRCPPVLAQRFWLHCAEMGETPGSVLRAFMLREVAEHDPELMSEIAEVAECGGIHARTATALRLKTGG